MRAEFFYIDHIVEQWARFECPLLWIFQLSTGSIGSILHKRGIPEKLTAIIRQQNVTCSSEVNFHYLIFLLMKFIISLRPENMSNSNEQRNLSSYLDQKMDVVHMSDIQKGDSSIVGFCIQ